MDTNNQKLAHALKIKYGLPPMGPTSEQLEKIKQHISTIYASGKTPSDADWRFAVYKYCPGAGSWKYAGLDNSDLNTLLTVAMKKP